MLRVIGALALFAFSALSADFTGKVVSITDGDTIRVLDGREQVRVRLYGIDCPERKQPFGTRARQFTGSLAHEKTVAVTVKDIDRYGRTVGVVTLPDGKNLNLELVKAGLAWWYRQYAPRDKELQWRRR